MGRVLATAKRGTNKPVPPGMRDMDAWTVTLRYQGRQMTVPFFMGYGYRGHAPDAAIVLEALLSDAASYENLQDVDDFMAEFGYDSRREAMRIYKMIENQTRRLQRFLGDDYEDAVWDGEKWMAEHV